MVGETATIKQKVRRTVFSVSHKIAAWIRQMWVAEVE